MSRIRSPRRQRTFRESACRRREVVVHLGAPPPPFSQIPRRSSRRSALSRRQAFVVSPHACERLWLRVAAGRARATGDDDAAREQGTAGTPPCPVPRAALGVRPWQLTSESVRHQARQIRDQLWHSKERQLVSAGRAVDQGGWGGRMEASRVTGRAWLELPAQRAVPRVWHSRVISLLSYFQAATSQLLLSASKEVPKRPLKHQC